MAQMRCITSTSSPLRSTRKPGKAAITAPGTPEISAVKSLLGMPAASRGRTAIGQAATLSSMTAAGPLGWPAPSS